MRLKSIEIKGFRCFSLEGQLIVLSDSTYLVGPNASGKTAMIIALVKMFSEDQAERTVKKNDFFLEPNEKLPDKISRELSIEVKIEFNELENEDKKTAKTVPGFFNQMVVDSKKSTPYCRIRLEATWTNDDTPDGEVQQKLVWISTPSDDPEIISENCRPVSPFERSKIRVIYLPASRDPSRQIKSTGKTSFGKLLKAVKWDGKDQEISKNLKSLNQELSELPGIQKINQDIQKIWSNLYDGKSLERIELNGLNDDPSILLHKLQPIFSLMSRVNQYLI